MARAPRVSHLLQTAHSALFRAADKMLRRKEGITTAAHGVLLVLSIRDPVPITTIANQLKMGKSSLTGLVDRMSKKGLVRRETSPQDGRVQLIHLESAGRDLVERTKSLLKHYNGRMLAPFSESEQRTIERFLLHVAEEAQADVSETPKTRRSKD